MRVNGDAGDSNVTEELEEELNSLRGLTENNRFTRVSWHFAIVVEDAIKQC